MDERSVQGALPGPEDYWRLGPVYVRKGLALLALAALSLGVLAAFGLPTGLFQRAEPAIPAYSYDDPALKEVSGLVRVLDAQGRVRYQGEVEGGACTGRGKVYDGEGRLVYDGPLVDGVYQGSEAKVYQDGVLVYTGEMAGNRRQGQGRRVSPEDGMVSEGQFFQDRLEGAGREYDTQGTLLRQGVFSQDVLEGEGQEYSHEGVLLRQGTFSAGVLHGDGAEYTADGALRYEGQFRRGVFWGQGTLYDTLLGVPVYQGAFVDGKPRGQGTLYHPSGQALYTGQVWEDRPRADAFLGLSLEELEAAFAPHWRLYSCGEVTAFVYPDFQLMFVTESPVELVSPAGQAEESERERQELLAALEGQREGEPAADGPARPAAPSPASTSPTDEALDAEADKSAITITQVLSYGQALPGVAQPDAGVVSTRHAEGWREWFCQYAAGERPRGASVRQSGQFVTRFTPLSSADAAQVEEYLAQGAGVETMTVLRQDKGLTLWYQAAKWREEP